MSYPDSMLIEITIPVPRNLSLAAALDWSAGVFQDFIDRGWLVRDGWTLSLSKSRWSTGRCTFIAERAGAKETPAFHLPPNMQEPVLTDAQIERLSFGARRLAEHYDALSVELQDKLATGNASISIVGGQWQTKQKD
jgi:hypothetical protein